MWQAKVILLTNRLFTWRSLFGSFLPFTWLEIFFKLVARVKRYSLYLYVRILIINVVCFVCTLNKRFDSTQWKLYLNEDCGRFVL